MTLQQLHYILTIAETGSMNKAAELLYVSQPNLTSTVRELEKEFGFAVFHRSGRGVTPTRDGVEPNQLLDEINYRRNAHARRGRAADICPSGLDADGGAERALLFGGRAQTAFRRFHSALFICGTGVCTHGALIRHGEL